MDTTHEAPVTRWPRTPRSVFRASCYLGIAAWGILGGFRGELAVGPLLSLACLTALVAGSVWWRILHSRRVATCSQADFMGGEYREAQLEELMLAAIAWVAPGLLDHAGWLAGIAIVAAFGFAWFKLTEAVVSRWPGKP